jgi:hypothetical protein
LAISVRSNMNDSIARPNESVHETGTRPLCGETPQELSQTPVGKPLQVADAI